MIFSRSSGILLHVTSLPGAHGIGDLGPVAHQFVDFLAAAGQTIWQVLPLNPTGYGDSPYQCFSAFAGNPLLIDLLDLQKQGLLSEQDFATAPHWWPDSIDYARVIDFKTSLLRKAAQTFFSEVNEPSLGAFELFCRDNSPWRPRSFIRMPYGRSGRRDCGDAIPKL